MGTEYQVLGTICYHIVIHSHVRTPSMSTTFSCMQGSPQSTSHLPYTKKKLTLSNLPTLTPVTTGTVLVLWYHTLTHNSR